MRDEQRNLVRWCGFNMDIDDRKRTEQKLRHDFQTRDAKMTLAECSVVLKNPRFRSSRCSDMSFGRLHFPLAGNVLTFIGELGLSAGLGPDSACYRFHYLQLSRWLVF